MAAALASAVLTNVKSNAKIAGKDLWKVKPCVVVAFRRPGCILCREEAQKVWGLKDQFDNIGVDLVGLVHERIPEEVDAFAPKFWPGPLYHDEEKAFYKHLGGGAVVRGSLLTFLNPFSAVWKHGKRAKQTVDDSNLKGDGLTMGGLFVVDTSGVVRFMHLERVFGEHAAADEVLKACKEVVA